MIFGNSSASETSAHSAVAVAKVQDTLLDSVIWVCEHYGLGRSPEVLTMGLLRGGALTPSLALTALQNAGLVGGMIERRLGHLPEQLVPIVLLRKDRGGMIYLGHSKQLGMNKAGKDELRYRVILPDVGMEPVELGDEELTELYAG